MYIDEQKLTLTELRGIAKVLGMSSALRMLHTKVQFARAISAWVDKR